MTKEAQYNKESNGGQQERLLPERNETTER